ncbi:MAG: TauD/TfdA family dioxygenase [Gammaproteobacteria bacterium]|nr:TauD/TfdA family dioxygenase [Gammaproteobacteria bacterium]
MIYSYKNVISTVKIGGNETNPSEICVSNKDRDLLHDRLKHSCGKISQEHRPDVMANTAAPIIKSTLGHTIFERILDKCSTGEHPYIIYRNISKISNLPPTPADDISPDEEKWRYYASVFLGILNLHNLKAAAFKDEMDGRLFHMVMPARNSGKSFHRSTKELKYHTEVVNGYFHEENPKKGAPISPEFFGLMCLRNPDNIPTKVLPVKKILNKMDTKKIHALTKPEFSAFSQSSFDAMIETKKVPVLVKCENGKLGIRYSSSKLRGITTEAEKALHSFKELMSNNYLDTHLNLSPGDLAIINNRFCLHGRGEIFGTQKFDGNDRWMLRVYGYNKNRLSKINFDDQQQHVMLVR